MRGWGNRHFDFFPIFFLCLVSSVMERRMLYLAVYHSKDFLVMLNFVPLLPPTVGGTICGPCVLQRRHAYVFTRKYPNQNRQVWKRGLSTALIIFLSKAIRGALRWAGENTSARHNTLRHLTSFHASSKTLPRWLGDPA
ncbi:hypothetical protein BGZ57DRAFT_173562 [Hyaloscypha finlandica]|nr:hypothetical protein BGZ57DRAFT_173562 [Hyaloscypha finlandica]